MKTDRAANATSDITNVKVQSTIYESPRSSTNGTHTI